jgi:hypothetical protein
MVDRGGAAELFRERAARASDEGRRTRAEGPRSVMEALLADVEHLASIGGWSWDLVTREATWSDEMYRIQGLEPQSVPAGPELLLSSIAARSPMGRRRQRPNASWAACITRSIWLAVERVEVPHALAGVRVGGRIVRVCRGSHARSGRPRRRGVEAQSPSGACCRPPPRGR